MSKRYEDVRDEIRIEEEMTAFIETESTSSDGQVPAKFMVSKTSDLSANGFQAAIDEPLPLHSLLRVGLEVAETGEQFRLVGEVMWVSESSESDKYLVGFKLIESEQTQILEWKEHVCQRLLDLLSELDGD